MTTYYYDATDAIRNAVARAPCAVGWLRGKGWFTYDPTTAIPADAQPEFLLLKAGRYPLVLSEDAADVWVSVVKTAVQKAGFNAQG